MYTIIVPDSPLGDCVCAIPYIQTKLKEGPCHVHLENSAVWKLLPDHPNLHRLDSLRHQRNIHDLVRILSVQDVFAYYGHKYHPSQAFFKIYGECDDPSTFPRIPVWRDFGVAPYPGRPNVVISPWVSNGTERQWPQSCWIYLVAKLKAAGLRVMQIGRSHEEMIVGAYSWRGHYLQDSYALCCQADLVITLDSGISRVMVGCAAKHLLVCANVVSPQWAHVERPNCEIIYDQINSIHPDTIFDRAMVMIGK